MADSANHRFQQSMENSNGSNNNKVSASQVNSQEEPAPQVNEESITSRPDGQPAENHRAPQPSRAKRYFERESKLLPPLFPQQGHAPKDQLLTPSILPPFLPSPTVGFQAALSPFLQDSVGDQLANESLTPISPGTPVVASFSHNGLSPLICHRTDSQHVGEVSDKNLIPEDSPGDPNGLKSRYGKRKFGNLINADFPAQNQDATSSLEASNALTNALNANLMPTFGISNPSITLRNVTTPTTMGNHFQTLQGPSQHSAIPNEGIASLAVLPESMLDFETGNHYGLQVPTNPRNTLDILQNNHALANTVIGNVAHEPGFVSPPTKPDVKGAQHAIAEQVEESHQFNGSSSAALPAMARHSAKEVVVDVLDPIENTLADRSYASAIQVLPQIIVDRPLVQNAELLEQRVVRTTSFSKFVSKFRQRRKKEGIDCVGGTMRRRSDLIKAITSIEAFGYPSTDTGDVHKILDITPGVSRESVAYLKNVAYCQLEGVKHAAHEALFQFSVLLVNQLRYRVMNREEILSLQCKVVDRFVVARNCILEKYIQYVRSRRWIENMSTNQRRGCLTHKQNNILRMWLYRNYSDPYPDEKVKLVLMQETDLSLDQVNNWLINARSRFWKPCMDYVDRDCLERKISLMIRHRAKMTTDEKLTAASSKYLAKVRKKKLVS